MKNKYKIKDKSIGVKRLKWWGIHPSRSSSRISFR